MKIDIHADDYALTPNTSKDMLKCMKLGKLNSISIISNMSCFDECMEMLFEAIPSLPFLPLMSVHINLVEGLSVYDNNDEHPEAIAQNGLLNLSWGKLYVMNYLIGKKNPIQGAIYNEVKAQIDKCQMAINKCIAIAKENNISCHQTGLRIDSHQHTHMIPIVWNACIKAASDGDYEIEYIRNSYEPLMVFLHHKELKKTYRLVNIVKNRILALHSKKADKLFDANDMKKMYLWGLIMSGKMDSERISALIDDVTKFSEKNGRTLEILFHPGTTLPEEVTEQLNPAAVSDFYLSSGRQIEMDAVMKLNVN